MKLFTIGFTKKTAKEFFELLSNNNVKRVIDIRLNNSSQLAGFAKADNLKYFLEKIANIEYMYKPEYAPSKELFDGYRKKTINWSDYVTQYNNLLNERQILNNVDYSIFDNACLLCSEAAAGKCHRRLIAEYLTKSNKEIKIYDL